MNRLFRDAGKVLCAFLAAITLIGQSVLPVYAGTAGAKSETSASGYTVSEETGFYTLDYFDRIAINSVRGVLTIKPGEDFTISFPNGWEHIPSFSVQDDILVVSGRKSADQSEKSSDGSVSARMSLLLTAAALQLRRFLRIRRTARQWLRRFLRIRRTARQWLRRFLSRKNLLRRKLLRRTGQSPRS